MRTGPTRAILAAGDGVASNHKRLRMATVKEFKGRYSLEETEIALQWAESESLEFVESSIDCVGSIFYNFVDFNELGAGISARSIRLTFHTQAGPQNHVRIWEGLMVIKDQHRVVHVWRAVK